MLSRIAESLFWIGRYVERAEDTARILDVHIHHLLEAPASSETETCQALLDVMGVSRSTAPPGLMPGPSDRTIAATVRTPAWSPSCWPSTRPTPVPSSPPSPRPGPTPEASARPSARRCGRPSTPPTTPCPARSDLGRRIGPYGFFRFVRERAAIIAGLTDSTMSRDDAWRFLVLGRSLERVDMLARLLNTAVRDGDDDVDWVILLRSCSAHEAFLRTYRREPEPALAAEFLLLDRLFPRSVFCALSTAEECLAELDPRSGRAGITDEARRVLGRVRTNLEFRRIDDAAGGPPRPVGRGAGRMRGGQRRSGRPVLPPDQPHRVDPRGPSGRGRLRRGDPIVTWRIQVEHHSHYEYADVVYSSYNEARITPMTTPAQLVLDARLEVEPAHQPYRYVDYWGSVVHAFDLHQPHREMDVSGPLGRGDDGADRPGIPLELGRTTERCRSGRVCRVARPHRASPGRPAPLPTSPAAYAPADSPADAALGRRGLGTGTVGLRGGHHGVHTSAIEAWDGGAGRVPGLRPSGPGRGTGHGDPRPLLLRVPPSQPGRRASVPRSTGRATPGSRFGRATGTALDPTVGSPIGDRHVLVARGRDYADVSPVKGIFHGGQTGRLDVTVGLTRLA